MKSEITLIREKIDVLEQVQAQQREELRLQVDATFESIKPINIIKNAFHDVVSSPEIKTSVVNNILGFGTGFITKKILSQVSHHPVANLAGTLIQMAVSNVVTNNPDGVKSVGRNILGFFFKPKTKPAES